MNLPELGTQAQFAALRDLLSDCDYTEPRICQELGLPSAEYLDLASLPERLAENLREPGKLNTLIRVFLLGESVPVAELEQNIPGQCWAAINALGLIEELPGDRSRCFSTIALYPVGKLFIASDRWSEPDHKPKQSFPDVVYPALTRSTREFLHFLPDTPCGRFLELCGGSGVAALIASRYAQGSWTSDITERSTHFAKFNILLNAADNVSALQGDLYAPVESRTFDRIAAHPPYMPVLRPAEIYYDGGEDGEQLTRRILEGLPRHLDPGGRFYCRTLGTDRKDGTFEQRLRSWLGSFASEFDIALFVSKNLDPGRFATDSAVRRATGQGEVSQWRALFDRLEVRELLTGVVVVQRRASDRRVFTIRRSLAAEVDCLATEKILQWETEMADERCAEKILASVPVASTRTELSVRHRLQDGEFAATDFTLSCDHPFLMDCQIQPWMGSLVARCDGSRTVKQLYAECREAGWIREDTPVMEFTHLVGMLVSGGFLSVESQSGSVKE